MEVSTVVNGESLTLDPELFIRSDGEPMAFMMPPTGIERQKVKYFKSLNF